MEIPQPTPLPVEVSKRGRFLNPDNRVIGMNIRRWWVRRQKQNPSWTQIEIARRVGIHPCSFSRILRGDGVREDTLLAIASALNVNPARFLVGVVETWRFPNVPRMGSLRSPYDAPRVGRQVRQLTTLLDHPEYLPAFVGIPLDEKTRNWVERMFWEIHEQTRFRWEEKIKRSFGRL